MLNICRLLAEFTDLYVTDLMQNLWNLAELWQNLRIFRGVLQNLGSFAKCARRNWQRGEPQYMENIDLDVRCANCPTAAGSAAAKRLLAREGHGADGQHRQGAEDQRCLRGAGAEVRPRRPALGLGDEARALGLDVARRRRILHHLQAYLYHLYIYIYTVQKCHIHARGLLQFHFAVLSLLLLSLNEME